MFVSLDGKWKVSLEGEDYKDKAFEVLIPGTLDESGIGGKDELLLKKEGREFVKADGPIGSRFTRKYSYYGAAVFEKKIDGELMEALDDNSRAFLKVERSRVLKLFVGGREVKALSGTLSTPYVFEITGLLCEGAELKLVCDNTYPNMPAAGIFYSSAATDETQTNWNGLLGKVGIEVVPVNHIHRINVRTHGVFADMKLVLGLEGDFRGKLEISCDALVEKQEIDVNLQSLKKRDDGFYEIDIDNAKLRPGAPRWDEYEGNLLVLSVVLLDENMNKLHEKASPFGIRDYGYDESGRLTINRRRFFLRGEANCAEFPETGHEPLELSEWLTVMERYKSYGVNVVRFHSHCPPKAAFEAADILGIMVQPELSHWNPVDAFLPQHSAEYYEKELTEIITEYGNHPSFVMLTLGNELKTTDNGIEIMDKLLNKARELDDTRLYAWGSNNFYGEIGCHKGSDFYTSSSFRDDMLRATSAGMVGHVNTEYPSACHDYNKALERLREEYDKPVFGFEVGQYEILPDFSEIDDFKGISLPVNYQLVKENAGKAGMLQNWNDYVEATGELALLCYKEEVEAVLRTPSMSGLSLLGLQDFPGQGTALVGMMNSHLQPKPFDFARPERFREFFRPVLPLMLLPGYTFTFSDLLSFDIKVANYSGTGFIGMPGITVTDSKSCRQILHADLKEEHFPSGELASAGKGKIRFSILRNALKGLGYKDDEGVCLKITVTIVNEDGCLAENSADIWVYPDVTPQRPKDIYEARRLDDKAIDILKNGGTVYLSPNQADLSPERSIKTQFSTDFWSVGTFDFQEGGMGQYIRKDHPVFKKFPTKGYTQWQWWPMANSLAVVIPPQTEPIVRELDSYYYLRNMAQLFECKCLNGRVLFSSMGLQNLQEFPEAKMLQNCIYEYLKSDSFEPANTLGVSDLEDFFN